MVKVWFQIVGSDAEIFCYTESLLRFRNGVHNCEVFNVTRWDKAGTFAINGKHVSLYGELIDPQPK